MLRSRSAAGATPPSTSASARLRLLRYVGIGLAGGAAFGFLSALLRPRTPAAYASDYEAPAPYLPPGPRAPGDVVDLRAGRPRGSDRVAPVGP